MHQSKDNASSTSTETHAIIKALIFGFRDQPILAANRLHRFSETAESEQRYGDALTFNDAQLKIGRELNAGPAVILALLSRGRLLTKTNDLPNAITHLQEALVRTSKEPSLPPEHAAHIRYTACNLIGRALWRSSQLDMAARALAETTTLARERFGAGSPEVMTNLFERAFLALEMRANERTLLDRISACVKEPSPPTASPEKRAALALELGTALYHHCMWDAASYTLDWAQSLSNDPVQKTEALLTLANIASYKSDIRAVHHLVGQAEKLWMDVAPQPRLERYMANLRAIAAMTEGRHDIYEKQISLAQQQGENEELSIEDRIQVYFTRAQAFRHAGLEDLARDEIKEAHRLVKRAIVSPLARFNTFLQQGFCEHVEKRFEASNLLIEHALVIAKNELAQNPILEARARTIKAHNWYAIYTDSGPSNTQAQHGLRQALADGQAALQLLMDGELDPYGRKVLLRLLSSVSNDLELPKERQAWYEREFGILDKEFPDNNA